MKINNENYKEFLLRYMEEDLNAEEIAEVDGFIDEEPVAINELRALERTKAQPDMKIVFPHKDRLKRNTETETPVRKLMWYTARAASMAAMLVITILFYEEFAVKPFENQASLTGEIPTRSVAFGSLQDEAIAGEQEFYLFSAVDEEFPVNVQVAGIVPNAPAYRQGIKNEAAIQPENVTFQENNKLNISKVNDKGTAVVFSGAEEAKMEKVSREQVQTALNLLKSRTVAYAEASKYTSGNEKLIPVISSSQRKNAIIQQTALADAKEVNEIEDIEGSAFMKAVNNLFKKHVSIKKQKQNDNKYYALTLETPAFKISKKIKSSDF